MKFLLNEDQNPAMKIFASVFPICLACTALVSCKKEFSASSLLGRWQVRNDSVIRWGPVVTKNNYVGQPGDYFDFRPNDTLYIKESALTDSFAFASVGDNKVLIHRFGWEINGVTQPTEILDLSANRVTLHVPNGNTPGFSSERFVYLVR